MMRVNVHRDAAAASRAAADLLAGWLVSPGTRTVMLASGNSPVGLYREIAARALPLGHLEAFAMDDYVGVPEFDPRTCGNFLRRAVADPWRVRLHVVSPVDGICQVSVRGHEAKIGRRGGIDVIVFGLGVNGHLGFNEPGSAPDSGARVIDLEAGSVEANRAWFGGDYAPSKGATVGLGTMLASQRAILLAFGRAKREAVRAMLKGPRDGRCPAAWLQEHPEAHVFLDREAAE